MSGPPPNIEASELWLALTQLPRPHRVVDFPRNLPGSDQPVGQVAIWPLTQEEQMFCNAEADRYTKELLKDPQKKDHENLGYQHTFANEATVQVLFRACRDPNNLQKAAFPSPKLLRAQLTTDEIGVLFRHYMTTQSEVGPIVSYMSEEEMDAWLTRLGEGGSAFPLDLLTWEMRDQLLMHSASRLCSFWKATISVGEPQSDSSSSTETEQSNSDNSSDSNE